MSASCTAGVQETAVHACVASAWHARAQLACQISQEPRAPPVTSPVARSPPQSQRPCKGHVVKLPNQVIPRASSGMSSSEGEAMSTQTTSPATTCSWTRGSSQLPDAHLGIHCSRPARGRSQDPLPSSILPEGKAPLQPRSCLGRLGDAGLSSKDAEAAEDSEVQLPYGSGTSAIY